MHHAGRCQAKQWGAAAIKGRKPLENVPTPSALASLLPATGETKAQLMNKKGLKFDNKSSMVSSWFHKQKMTYARRCSVNHGHRREAGAGSAGNNSSLGIPAPSTDQTGTGRESQQTSVQHSQFMSCDFTEENPPFWRQPGAGQADHMPSLPPRMLTTIPAGSQSLGNMKFLGPFCSLKTDDFAKRPLHPSGMSHVSTGTDTPAGPASITRELEAAGPPPAAWQHFSPPKPELCAHHGHTA